MSVSLYYEAKRSQPITRQELDACMEIAKRYDRQYPYGELYEGFCIYDPEEAKTFFGELGFNVNNKYITPVMRVRYWMLFHAPFLLKYIQVTVKSMKKALKNIM